MQEVIITADGREIVCYPLTHAQKRIWYIEKLYPDTSLYNIGGPSRIRGKVDFRLLEESIQLFVQKNDGIRLHFLEQDGEVKQYVSEYQRLKMDFVDFSSYPDPEREFDTWIRAEIRKPYQLHNSDLFYFALFKIDEQNAGLFVRFHHIIADGWSINVASEQIYGVYKELLLGEEISAEPEISYIEYIHNEQKYIASERFAKDRTFWSEKFQTLPEPVISHGSETTAGNRILYRLDPELSGKLQAFVANHKHSLNTFFVALFLIYLARVTQREDLIVGTPVLNRSGKRERSIFGMFTSTMPFRATMDFFGSVLEMMGKVNEGLINYFFHQKYPYDLLVQDLELKKKGYNHLIQVCVNYYNTKLNNEVNGYPIENTELYNGNQFYSLQLVIKEWSDQITLELDYKLAEYTRVEMDSLYHSLLYMTRQILANPGMAIVHLDLLPEAEKEKQLAVFNATAREYPQEKTIIQLIEEKVVKSPDRIAISFGNHRYTYLEMNRRANQLARLLRSRGVGRNTMVGLLTTHSPESVIGILGIIKAGGAYIPIDPAYPPDRIAYMLEDAGCRWLLTNCSVDDDLPFDGELIDLTCEEYFSGEGGDLPRVNQPMDLVYMIYTSGSTGKPKGVMIEHRGLVNYIWWAKKVYVQGEDDIFALYSSLSFDLTVTSIFTPLIGGNEIIVYRDDGPEYVLYRIMNENRATIVKLTPSHLSLLVDRDNRESVVRCFIVGGEDLKLKLAAKIHESFGGKVAIFNEYGPTETVVGCMIHRYDPGTDSSGSVPIGVPADNVQIYLLDRYFMPLPSGSIGEMYIAGDGVARGYWNRPELTAEKFVPNPFEVGPVGVVPVGSTGHVGMTDRVGATGHDGMTDHVGASDHVGANHDSPLQAPAGGRLYRTGDLARFLANGKIEYIGRADHQVKIHGYRIELGEIEKHLVSLTMVRDCVVIDRQNANGDKYLCAYVVTDGEMDREKEVFSIRNELLATLPEYMVPKYFMTMEEIPLTPNGKVNRSFLPEPVMDDENCAEYVPPETEVQQALVAVVEKVLNTGGIGMKSDFFAYGGDSIKAIQIASKLHDQGYRIRAREILSHPVLMEMATCIETVSSQIHQGPCEGTFSPPPVYAWFLAQQFQEPHYYNQSVVLHLKRRFRGEEIGRMMEQLVRVHDALRLNLDPETGRLFYHAKHLQTPITVHEIDLTGLSSGTQEAEFLRQSEEIKAGFELAHGLLIRAALFNLGDAGQQLLITAHHLVVDGVSWRILLDDLYRMMCQMNAGESLSLPAKTHSLLDWTRELELYAATVSGEERVFWDRVAHHPFRFPADFDNGEDLLEVAAESHFNLTEEETGRLLRQTGTAYGTEPHELLIAALSLTIRDFTSQGEIIIELEGHGREEIGREIDITRTVGWFTSMYPVLFPPAGLELPERIKMVKETLRTVPGKGIGFGLLKTYGNALFQERKHIRFNYLGDFDASGMNDFFWASYGDSGVEISRKNHLTALIDINAAVTDQKLQVSVTWSKNKFHERTMLEFTRKFVQHLRTVIEHCVSKDSTDLTPSDFDLVKLDADDIEGLFT